MLKRVSYKQCNCKILPHVLIRVLSTELQTTCSRCAVNEEFAKYSQNQQELSEIHFLLVSSDGIRSKAWSESMLYLRIPEKGRIDGIYSQVAGSHLNADIQAHTYIHIVTHDYRLDARGERRRKRESVHGIFGGESETVRKTDAKTKRVIFLTISVSLALSIYLSEYLQGSHSLLRNCV